MLFTRLPEKKYLLGIDLGDSFCQISYLNTRRLTAGMDPHTFSYVMGREEFNIPAAAFQILRPAPLSTETRHWSSLRSLERNR